MLRLPVQFQRSTQVMQKPSGKPFRVLAATAALSLIGTLMPGGMAAIAQTSPSDRTPQSTDRTPSSRTEQDTSVNRPVDGVRFACQMVNGQHTVMYYPQSQPDQAYPWAVPAQLGGGWTPERRCAEISRRLESYRPDGLVEMQTSTENGYNIICVTSERDSSCRIVLTVPPGQDPVAIRDRVFENLTVADSGQQTSGVATFTNDGSDDIINQIGRTLNLNLPGMGQTRSDGIDLRPFLDTNDGGTGTRLQGGVPIQGRSNRLNPNNFR